jgi:hypothetical protein
MKASKVLILMTWLSSCSRTVQDPVLKKDPVQGISITMSQGTADGSGDSAPLSDIPKLDQVLFSFEGGPLYYSIPGSDKGELSISRSLGFQAHYIF